MASRADRRKRKALIAERSAQARANEQQRTITNLNSFKIKKLDQYTPLQLQQAARLFGQKQSARKAEVLAEAQQSYYNVPVVHVTKFDREMASRPLVSDSTIASAPSKQRHVLRQQQSRRIAARQKIERAKYYDQQRQQRTIEQQQWRERHGAGTADPQIMQNVLTASPEFRDILNSTNVLGDEKFMTGMDVKTLKRELRDAAKRTQTAEDKEKTELLKLYKKARAERNRKRRKEQKTRQQYLKFLREMQLKGAFDKVVAHQFARLTNKEIRWMMKHTAFGLFIKNFIGNSPEYETWEAVRKYAKNNKFKFVSDDEKQKQKVRQALQDFMSQAHNMAR